LAAFKSGIQAAKSENLCALRVLCVMLFHHVEIFFDIIHEDADLLVINKPAGLVCHPTKNGEMSSLIGRTRLYLKDSAQPHLVNRLDRETSGVVVVTKNSQVAGELGKIMESRSMQKEYLAIVHGHMRDDHGFIDAPLGKDERSLVAVKDCVRPDGALSQTEFWVERRFANHKGEFSLVRLQPLTGRKHQLRIHLAHIGHSIVGDKLYGGDEDLYLALVQSRLTDEQKQRLIFPHQALHARSVQFVWRDRSIEFVCDPELWFTEFLR
jgi:23S rRNA pseudouridine1911/1915/1917 synthase